MLIRFVFLQVTLMWTAVSHADTWHVNNLSGKDDNAGGSEKQAFRTLAQAVKAAKTSDTISIANTGEPYREPLALVRLGGTPSRPFVIEGNGAVISGLRKIDSDRWQKNGNV